MMPFFSKKWWLSSLLLASCGSEIRRDFDHTTPGLGENEYSVDPFHEKEDTDRVQLEEEELDEYERTFEPKDPKNGTSYQTSYVPRKSFEEQDASIVPNQEQNQEKMPGQETWSEWFSRIFTSQPQTGDAKHVRLGAYSQGFSQALISQPLGAELSVLDYSFLMTAENMKNNPDQAIEHLEKYRRKTAERSDNLFFKSLTQYSALQLEQHVHTRLDKLIEDRSNYDIIFWDINTDNFCQESMEDFADVASLLAQGGSKVVVSYPQNFESILTEISRSNRTAFFYDDKNQPKCSQIYEMVCPLAKDPEKLAKRAEEISDSLKTLSNEHREITLLPFEVETSDMAVTCLSVNGEALDRLAQQTAKTLANLQ